MASNLPLLEEAAAKLKHLLLEVVFVGGSTLDLIHIRCRRDHCGRLRRLFSLL
jgi:hypothetical protein